MGRDETKADKEEYSGVAIMRLEAIEFGPLRENRKQSISRGSPKLPGRGRRQIQNEIVVEGLKLKCMLEFP